MIKKIPVVEDFMTRKVVVVTPDMDIHDAMTLLLTHHISGAPVVDGTQKRPGKLVGVLSEKDCLTILSNGAFYGEGLAVAGTVADFMTRDVVAMSPADDIFKVADVFLKRHFRRMPVVSRDHELLGIVSRRDVLNVIQSLHEYRFTPPDPGYVSERVKARLSQTDVFHVL